MKRAAKKATGIAARIDDKLRALVRTAIVEHVRLPVFAANEHDGLASDQRLVVIPRIGDLAFMADVNPGVAENPVHLEVEYILVGVDSLVDLILFDEGSDILQINCHWALPVSG